MKRFFLVSFIIYILVAVGVWAYVRFALNDQVKAKIEQTVNQDPNKKLTIGGLRIGFVPPIRLTLTQVRFQNTATKQTIEIPSVSAKLTPRFPFLWEKTGKAGDLELEIESPAVQIEKVEEKLNEAETRPLVSPEQLAVIPQFSLKLKVENGKVRYVVPDSNVEIDKLGLLLSFNELRDSWSIRYSSENKLTLSKAQHSVPVKAELQVQDALKEKVTIEQMKAEVFGIPIQMKGWIEPGSLKSDLKLEANVDDLSKLSSFYSNVTQAKFLGGFTLSATLANETGKSWKSTGQVRAKQINGDLNYPLEDGVAKGPFSLDASVDFYYNETLSFPLMKVNGDFKDTEIKYGTFFHKPSGTRLSLNIESDSDGTVMSLRSFTLGLAQITASGSGKIATKPGTNSSLSFRIPKTELTGLEKSFPPLSKSPLKGTFEVSADVRGDFSKPETLLVSLSPLLLNSVSGHIDWSSADGKTSIKGPLSITAKAELNVAGKELKTANISANGNLTALQITSEGTFSKTPSMPLEFVLDARKAGNQIDIKSAKIKLLTNTATLGGKVSEPQKPNLDVWMKLTQFSYAELGKMLPAVAELKLNGTGSADIQLRGVYDTKLGFTGSPLTLSGLFKTQIDRYTLASSKNAPPKEKKPPEPILPAWPVLQSANIRTVVGIGEIQYDSLKIDKVQWDGTLNQGNLIGKLQIAKIFSGSLNLNSFSMSLKQLQPDVKINGAFSGVDVNEMATYYSPTWKDLVKGFATGNVSLTMPDSERADFKERLHANGDMQLKQAYFSTIQIDQLIQEKLSKIPGMADKQHVRTNGVAGDLNTKFTLANGKMDLDPFHFLTPDQNELRLKGWVGLDAAMDLNGAAYLVKSPVRGSIQKANSDERGRLIVPLQLKGNLMDPEISLAEATIKEMLEKTARYELKEKEEELKRKANEKIQEEFNKKKEELKKGIGGLLGK